MIGTFETANQVAMTDFKATVVCDDLVEIGFDGSITGLAEDDVECQTLVPDCLCRVVAQSDDLPVSWFVTRLA